jgi:cytochrome c-type biogenesis protein CcmF
MFNFFMVFLLSLVAIGQLLRWKRHPGEDLSMQLKVGIPVAVVAGLVLPWAVSGTFHWQVWLGLSLAFWLLAGLIRLLLDRVRHASKPLRALARAGGGFWGMWLAHLGIVFMVIGVVLVSNYEVTRDYRMAPGDRVEMGNYEFEYLGTRLVDGPNYRSEEGVLAVYRDGRQITSLLPEKKYYTVQSNTMTEAGIDGRLFRDLYVSMAEPLDENRQIWSMRLQVKPFVRWIWLGAIFMAIGGVVAVLDRRYFKKVGG